MKLTIRFYCALGVSAALLAFLPRFEFRIVAETPSRGMGLLCTDHESDIKKNTSGDLYWNIIQVFILS